MGIAIITLFPEIFPPVLNSSILGRAQEKGLVKFDLVNLRDFGLGVHKQVDDRPYGGGVGMVLRPDVLASAVKSVWKRYSEKSAASHPHTVLLSASGRPFNQAKAHQLARLENLILICGHYEGIDQRFIDHYVDEELSIGDYVLTGGELPAMVVVDSVTRLIPGVLEKADATREESFEQNLLEYPQYTRPEIFEGERVPEVLLSGNHQKIAQWRQEKSLKKTQKIRPDLLKRI